MADVIGAALSRGSFMQLTFINGDEMSGNVSLVTDEHGGHTGLYAIQTGPGEFILNPAHILRVRIMSTV